MAQFARPSADVSSGPFLPSTSTTLFGVIDETALDTTDYAYATSTGTFQVDLGTVTDPAVSTGHIARFNMSGNGSQNANVTLYDTTTSSAVSTFAVTTVPAAGCTYAFTLSGAAADSISSYANLR